MVTITNDTDSFAQNRAYQVIPADLVCSPLWVPSAPQVVYVSSWAGATSVCDDEDFPVESNGYGFKVASGFDLNQNLTLETGDIETWLIDPVDFDESGHADAIDLGLLVDAVVNGDDE
ncbi:MAG: hypothetical protein KJZ65_00720 [Phycisphaerales bacterium]|nr:hypothetical protein [Phycisphaerales bacterium]